MSYCLEPLLVTLPGSFASADPQSGKVKVRCRKCRNCIADRKNDVAGKLMAEAEVAGSVYFLTLTYADEPSDFVYRDVQLMLKQMRKAFAKGRRPAQIRFFCVGERGNLKGRIHWHLLLFFDRKVSIAPPRKGRLWRFWEFGWAQVAAVSNGDRVKRVRYCAKYAVKSLGQEDKSCRPRASVGLGQALMLQEAERTVEAGLPFHGVYTVGDLVFTRGPKAGQRQRFRMLGAGARKAAVRYVETWEAKRGDKWPDSHFLDRYYQARPPSISLHMSVQYRKQPFVYTDGVLEDAGKAGPIVFSEAQTAEFVAKGEAAREKSRQYCIQQRDAALGELYRYEAAHPDSAGACRAARAIVRSYWDGRKLEIDVPAFVPEGAYVPQADAPIPDVGEICGDLPAHFRRKIEREAEKDRKRVAERVALRADLQARAAYRAERFLKVNGKLPKGVAIPKGQG